MKSLLITTLLFISFGFTSSGSKPKIKQKDNLVTVEGTPYFKHEMTRAVFGYNISSPDGEQLFFLRQEKYNDPTKATKSNSTTTVYYYSLIREGGTEVLCELRSAGGKYLAKLLMEYTVLDTNGKIIEANFQKMVTHAGMTFSANRPVIIR